MDIFGRRQQSSLNLPFVLRYTSRSFDHRDLTAVFPSILPAVLGENAAITWRLLRGRVFEILFRRAPTGVPAAALVRSGRAGTGRISTGGCAAGVTVVAVNAATGNRSRA